MYKAYCSIAKMSVPLRVYDLCMQIYIYICMYITPDTLNIHFFDGCFSWIIPNLYIKTCCFTKHPFKTCLFGVPGIYQY